MSNDLQKHVDNIANQIENVPASYCENCGHYWDDIEAGEPCMACKEETRQVSAFDWLEDALDIEYIVNGSGDYLGARILVTFGGPNIWVDTRRKIVDGHWWGDSATASFRDELGIDEALEECWDCQRH